MGIRRTSALAELSQTCHFLWGEDRCLGPPLDLPGREQFSTPEARRLSRGDGLTISQQNSGSTRFPASITREAKIQTNPQTHFLAPTNQRLCEPMAILRVRPYEVTAIKGQPPPILVARWAENEVMQANLRFPKGVGAVQIAKQEQLSGFPDETAIRPTQSHCPHLCLPQRLALKRPPHTRNRPWACHDQCLRCFRRHGDQAFTDWAPLGP
jgi:hypothetical protein